jgi:flagellar protein FlaG
MFDAIGQTAKIGNPEEVAAKKEPLKQSQAPPPPSEKKEEAGGKKALSEQSALSQDFLNELEKDIEMIHNVGLQFSVHKSTGRIVIKVFNKDTGRLIREVPPESVLNLSAKLDEMMGILFDETV